MRIHTAGEFPSRPNLVQLGKRPAGEQRDIHMRRRLRAGRTGQLHLSSRPRMGCWPWPTAKVQMYHFWITLPNRGNNAPCCLREHIYIQIRRQLQNFRDSSLPQFLKWRVLCWCEQPDYNVGEVLGQIKNVDNVKIRTPHFSEYCPIATWHSYTLLRHREPVSHGISSGSFGFSGNTPQISLSPDSLEPTSNRLSN